MFGSKAVIFTLEATLSLIMLVSILSTISAPTNHDLTRLALYKQASDILEIGLNNNSIVDEEDVDVEHLKKMMRIMDMHGTLIVGKKEYMLSQGEKHIEVYVERTLVTPSLEYKTVVLRAWK